MLGGVLLLAIVLLTFSGGLIILVSDSVSSSPGRLVLLHLWEFRDKFKLYADAKRLKQTSLQKPKFI